MPILVHVNKTYGKRNATALGHKAMDAITIPRGYMGLCDKGKREVREDLEMYGVRGKTVGHQGLARAQLP